MEMFKVIIAGGRNFNDYPRLKSYCKHVLQNQSNVEVVSGTADGADNLGEDFAIEFKLGLKSEIPKWLIMQMHLLHSGIKKVKELYI